MQEIAHQQHPGSTDIAAPLPAPLSEQLLLSNLILEVDNDMRTLSLLGTQFPHVLAQQQFTRNEWALLVILLQHYPSYVPHEKLLARLSLLSEADCRQRLQELQARDAAVLKRELKPMYRALSGVRIKLQKLYPQLKVSLLRSAGYVILVSPSSQGYERT